MIFMKFVSCNKTHDFDLSSLAVVTCCRTGQLYEWVTHIAFVFSLFLVHKPVFKSVNPVVYLRTKQGRI